MTHQKEIILKKQTEKGLFNMFKVLNNGMIVQCSISSGSVLDTK